MLPDNRERLHRTDAVAAQHDRVDSPRKTAHVDARLAGTGAERHLGHDPPEHVDDADERWPRP